MSAERLREMLSEATPGPWRADFRHEDDIFVEEHVTIRWAGDDLHDLVGIVPLYLDEPETTQADARLIALAPDAIALLADIADGPIAYLARLTPGPAYPSEVDTAIKWSQQFLARLDALCGDDRA